MTDEELVHYADLHCRTERALFSTDHLRRLYRMAGWSLPTVLRGGRGGFYEAHEEVILPLLARIREGGGTAPSRPCLAAVLAIVAEQGPTTDEAGWRAVLRDENVELCERGVGVEDQDTGSYGGVAAWTLQTVPELVERLAVRGVLPMDDLTPATRRFHGTRCAVRSCPCEVACLLCTRNTEGGPCTRCYNRGVFGVYHELPETLWEAVSFYSLGPHLATCETLAQELYERFRPWLGEPVATASTAHVVWRVQKPPKESSLVPSVYHRVARGFGFGYFSPEWYAEARRAAETIRARYEDGGSASSARAARELHTMWCLAAQKPVHRDPAFHSDSIPPRARYGELANPFEVADALWTHHGVEVAGVHENGVVELFLPLLVNHTPLDNL